MTAKRSQIAGGLGLAWCGAVLLSACATPTEIRLRVHTNLPCTEASQWRGVAIYAGAPGPSLETKAPTLISAHCDADGQIGTLVIVPSDSKDEEVGVRVVGGIAHAPDDCAAHDYTGCIVARREVRFNRHERLDLDVELTSECVGFGCDVTHTCVAAKCTATESVPPEPGSPPDAGPTPSNAGASVVRCGDNGLFCPTSGNVCCLSADRDAGTTHGECMDPAKCPPQSSVLNCDDESDCSDYAEGDLPGICLISYVNVRDVFIPGSVTSTQCFSYSVYRNMGDSGLGMCQTRSYGCLNDRYQCVASWGEPTNPMPGYFWCRMWSAE